MHIVVLISTIFIFGNLLWIVFNIFLTPHQSNIIYILTFIFFLRLVLYFLYSLHQVNQIKLKIPREAPEESNIYYRSAKDNIEKSNQLYIEVTNYMDKNQPYCKYDLTIAELANQLDYPIVNISKAIKINTDMNFNMFVNTYRINKVKEMLYKDIQQKYTIHLYIVQIQAPIYFQ